MGDMSEYYDDRDSSKEDLQRLFYRSSFHNKQTYTAHLIYQNELMDAGYTLQERIDKAINRYLDNGIAKVGETIRCPSCNTKFKKVSYQQKFCKAKVRGKSNCKDFYHNFAGGEARRLRAKIFTNN